MNDAKAAKLRDCDCEGGLGDRVHARTQDGNLQTNVAAEGGADIDLRGEDVRFLRYQKNVFEGQRFPEIGIAHGSVRLIQLLRSISCISFHYHMGTARCGPLSQWPV